MNDTIDVVAQPDEDLALVALTPAELPSQQAALSAWCDRKIDPLGGAQSLQAAEGGSGDDQSRKSSSSIS